MLGLIAGLALALLAAAPASAAEQVPDGPRIVGGQPANRAATPWYVLINPYVGGQSYVCGATAISSHWIVTAAHCVTDPNTNRAQSGADIANSGMYVNPVSLSQIGTRLPFSQVVINPYWNRQNNSNDIALIRTTATLPASLPYSTDTSGPKAGTAMEVFGFGATSYGGQLSQVLKMASVIDIAGVNSACGGYGSYVNLALMVCAGTPGGGTDSCQGDSGGPLTALASGTRVQVGIVSFGVECGQVNYPGIYTRIARYGSWIEGVTGVSGTSAFVGVRTKAKLYLRSPCASKKCQATNTKPLALTVGNTGGTAATYSVTSPKLKASPAQRSIASGTSAKLRLTPASKKAKGCSTVKVNLAEVGTVKLKVRVNGGKC